MNTGRHDRSRSSAGHGRSRARTMLDPAAVLSRREADAALGGHDLPGGHRAGAGDRAALPARAGNGSWPSCRWRRWRCASGSAWRSPPRPPTPRASSGARSPPPDVLVLAGWAAPRVFAVPGPRPAHQRPVDGACPARVCAALAVVCLVLAVVAAPSHAGVAARPAHRGGRAARAGARRRRAARRARRRARSAARRSLAAGAHIHSHGSPRERASCSRRCPAARAATTSTRPSPRRTRRRSSVALIVAAGTDLRLRRGRVPAPARRARPGRLARRRRPPGVEGGWHEPRPPRRCLRARRASACSAASAGPALAHATLLGRDAAASGGRGVSEGQQSVALRFSEPVQILNRSDVSVVNAARPPGRHRRARTRSRATRAEVIIPLRGPLLPYSYTVRYRVVSADSHAESVGVRVRRRQGAARRRRSSPAPAACRTRARPRSPRASSSSTALGLLRRPARLPRCSSGARRSTAARRPGRRRARRARCAAGSTAVLARVLGARDPRRRSRRPPCWRPRARSSSTPGCVGALLHPTDAYRLVAASRFGDLLGWRCGALFVLVAVGVRRLERRDGRARPSAGRRWPLAAHGGCSALAALTLLADQGHASQAPLAPLSVAADAVHLAGAAIWIGGLPCLVAVLLRAPRALPDGGPDARVGDARALQQGRAVVGRRDLGHRPRADGRRAVVARTAVGAPATAAT